MNNLYLLRLIFILSIILGVIKYGSLNTKGWPWQSKFVEFWNDTVNFSLTGLIGYYFVLIRWPKLENGEALGLSDFVLFILFAMGLFGHLCVLSINITEGITAILKRVLEGK